MCFTTVLFTELSSKLCIAFTAELISPQQPLTLVHGEVGLGSAGGNRSGDQPRSKWIQVDQSEVGRETRAQCTGESDSLHVLVLVDHVVVVLQHWGDGLLILGHLKHTHELRTASLFFQGK